ncbi:glucose-6-phosphate exchanger SLC37A2-like [Hyalella azteca]|uniref:Glucose-6-phosphate exchanger SLC37A2-like n=1 Tax=Hyalella azteca TaxID=294128 RepID=A0A8B7MYJ8_HYAAZ|nr:glucose-6-phosphate exchanger SLC37A2-like [Hyalella azteca]XP_018006388.1 glucose-6-phosphate exchanger SLC37A2-like [Hyalella azteca]XP_018006390.1 glucose-6-phosphate exchanger SLC37A2-like [Hyalella azteca]XP_018006391.1 glucose-6-phosphate exchanger SLC37A2-like [Hyalella azteca]XP_018006392.1 glucose-6-phosphate exchanger SLC37A2-like [Hyalella azteca]
MAVIPKHSSRYLILALLWLAYSSSYLLRKPLALVKTHMMSEFRVDLTIIGFLDVALLLPYSVFSLTIGWLADSFGARMVLGAGLCLGATSFALIGQVSSLNSIFFLLFVTGASQALGWPTCSSILTDWFHHSERNSAFGIFGTSAFGGSVLATYLAVYLLEVMQWQSIFIYCAIIPGACGLLVILLAKSPKEYKLLPVDSDDQDCKDKLAKSSESLTFFQVMKLQLLPEICFSIVCSKCVRYAVLLWLPMFLQKGLNYSTMSAGIGSTAYDIGGVVGSLLNDLLVRYFFRSNNFFASYMTSILTCVFLGLFTMSGHLGISMHMILLFLAGLFNSATDILLTGPIAADLGVQYDARVAVSGVINGMGSLGAVIQGPIVGWVGTTWGWTAVVPCLIILSAVGALASFRAFRVQGQRYHLDKMAAET